MAAGLGFKTFTTGEVLTAGDVNGYLMQGVLVFASAAARNSAITSPQEGQFAFTKDTNGLWYYDGAAWVASGATGDIEGVTAGTGISGGGTSGTVTVTNSMATAMTTSGDLIQATGSGTFARLATGTSGQYLTTNGTTNSWASVSAGGMTLLATVTAAAATSVSFTSISGSYKHLLLVWERVFSSVNNTAYWVARCNDNTGGNHSWAGSTFTSLGAGAQQIDGFGNAADNAVILGGQNTEDAAYNCYGAMWFYDYSDAARGTTVEWKSYNQTTLSALRYSNCVGNFGITAAITQIEFIRNSTQTITGTFRLYGVS